MSAKNRAWHLVSRPQGLPTMANFELRESPIPELQDGWVRVEISYESVRRITAHGRDLSVSTGSAEAEAAIESLTCTCGKRGDGSHTHYFLESSVLRDLTPGDDVRIELINPGRVRISPAESAE